MTEPETLKIGLLLDGRTGTAWVARAIEKLLATPVCTLELVILGAGRSASPSGFVPRVRDLGPRGQFLVRRHLRRDEGRFSGQDPFSPTDLASLLDGLHVLESPLQAGGPGHGPGEDPLERLSDVDLDVLLDLREDSGTEVDPGALRTRVWSLEPIPAGLSGAGPPGYWEGLSGEPLTGITLISRNPSGAGKVVLAETQSATRFESTAENRSNCYWKSPEILARELARLHAMGSAEYYSTRSKVVAQDHNGSWATRPPGNGRMIWLLSRNLISRITGKVRRLVSRQEGVPQWFLFLAERDGEGGSPAQEATRANYRAVIPPRGQHWADPFLIRREGADWLFFEEVRQDGGYGVIRAAQVGDEGLVGEPKVVLERPYHLSYPFLLERDGDLFMIPESGDAARLDAYRCVDFPWRWEHFRVLMEGTHLYDATLVEHEGRWWLFGVVVSSEGISTDDELFLFSSDDSLSDSWTPHPENPIVSNAARARPGGPILKHEGQLYRLGQDSRYQYGSALRIFRIDRLSDTEYGETEAGELEPRWLRSVRGFHHMCFSETMIVADARASSIPLGHR